MFACEFLQLIRQIFLSTPSHDRAIGSPLTPVGLTWLLVVASSL